MEQSMTQESKKDIEKTITNDMTNQRSQTVKIPKKRGRKPKYPPESRKLTINKEDITISFD